MTTKRPSFKERAFEKLGFGQRFRGNSTDSATEHGNNTEDDHSRTVWYTPSMDTDTDAPHSIGKVASAPIVGIASANVPPGVTTPPKLLGTDVHSQSTTQISTKPKRIKPEGTVEYHVKDLDTLESIAAFWDTTPSELKKVNKLTSRLIFPEQILYVPDPLAVPESEKSGPPVSSSPEQTSLKADIPIVKMSEKTLSKVPGHAERQTPLSSPTLETEVPHKLSEEEAKELDQECYERFIKVSVKHITDGQGVVSGVLLVTPNAVMFDPNVSDPLVLEHGAERYGVIAPMDMIVSAAMYHDIAAMSHHNNADSSPSSCKPKPEVYHDRNCPLYPSWCEGHGERFISQDRSVDTTDHPVRSSTITSQMSEADSLCSCGAGVDSADKSPMQIDRSPVLTDKSPVSADRVTDQTGEAGLDSDKITVQGDNNVAKKDPVAALFRPHSNSLDEFGDFQSAEGPQEVSNQEQITLSQENVHKSQEGGGEAAGHDVGSHIVSTDSENAQNSSYNKFDTTEKQTDSDISNVANLSSQTTNSQQEPSGTPSTGGKTAFYLGSDDVTNSDVNTSDNKPMSEEGNESESNNEMRIGNIVYLPVSEGEKGEINLQAMEALSKLSLDQFEQRDRSESAPVDMPDGSNKSNIDNQRHSNSFGSFNVSPHLSAFVNYATGLFRAGSDVKDISDVISGEQIGEQVTDGETTAEKTATTPKLRDVENAITLADKPELFQSFDVNQGLELIPRPATTSEDLPLYLCLRLGMPVNKEVSQTCPIQAYSKIRKKPEYWFSIPRDKVDQLYAFFVQWTPEIYGGDEDSAEKRGFVVLEEEEDNSDDEKLEILDEYFSTGMAALHKDWEIISADEALKRKVLSESEDSMIMPELIGQSTILEEGLIYMLSRFLPPRTIGYPWTLLYSSERHGFSLRTLYRDMHGIDSPILLVVKDTNDNIFGALTSCAYKVSDSFYGTGESFLFTFYPEFKVFRWTGENNFFIKGNQESLSIGAGQGKFGLWFDEDIYHGRTNRCETYDNDLLTESEDFVVKTLEAWAFIQD